MRQLSPTEREWKQRIYDRLLKVLDLSLLGSLEESAALLKATLQFRKYYFDTLKGSSAELPRPRALAELLTARSLAGMC